MGLDAELIFNAEVSALLTAPPHPDGSITGT
jgi:hypothetical protein